MINYKRWVPMLLGIIAVTASFSVQAAEPASYTVATGSGIDVPLNSLIREFTGPLPKAFACMVTAITGIMLMFGEVSGLARKAMQIAFGTAIVLNIGTWLVYIGTVGPVAGGDTGTLESIHSMTDANFLSTFVTHVQVLCKQGATRLQTAAISLLIGLAIIEMALALCFDFNRDHLKYIFIETFKVGFFIFLVQQWVGGTYGFAANIFDLFGKMGLLAGGELGTVAEANPDNIVVFGFALIAKQWQTILNFGMTSVALILTNIIVMLAIIVCVFITVIEIVIVKLEFWIISVVTIPLIPFGINKHTKFLFEKAVGAVFSLGIKYMVLTFVTVFSVATLKQMSENMSATIEQDASKLSATLMVLLGCILVALITKRAPELAQGLLSGSPTLSGSTASQAARGVAGAATNVAGKGMAVAGALSFAKTMHGGRNADGSTNWGGTAANLASMAKTRIARPYHHSFADQANAFTNKYKNNQNIKEAEKGDMGRSLARRMEKNNSPANPGSDDGGK